MRSLRSADLATGCLLSAVGMVFLIASMRIEVTVAGERLHPRTFPLFLSSILVLLGIALAIEAWQYRGEQRPVPWPNASGFAALMVTMASLVAYLATLELLGFPLATVLFVSFMTWYLGRYRFWLAALCGVASGSIMLFLFVGYLGLSLPLGLLELFL